MDWCTYVHNSCSVYGSGPDGISYVVNQVSYNNTERIIEQLAPMLCNGRRLPVRGERQGSGSDGWGPRDSGELNTGAIRILILGIFIEVSHRVPRSGYGVFLSVFSRAWPGFWMGYFGAPLFLVSEAGA